MSQPNEPGPFGLTQSAGYTFEAPANVLPDGYPYPSIRERGGKLGPLELGFVSLFCDPLLIVSFLATSRGIGDLRELRRREEAGYFAENHLGARGAALWGLFLPWARLAALLFFVVNLFVTSGAPAPEPRVQYDVPTFGESELEEILAELDSPEPDERALARAHAHALALEAGPDAATTLREAAAAPRRFDTEATRAALLEAASAAEGNAEAPADAEPGEAP